MLIGQRRDWLRGTQVDEGLPSNSLQHYHRSYAAPHQPAMFATNLNNRPVSSLYPSVVGQHPLGIYNLTNAVGTITGINSRTFDRTYDLSGRYPSNHQVRLVFLLMEQGFARLVQIVDCMLKEKVCFGTDAQTSQCWDQDLLSDCSPEDTGGEGTWKQVGTCQEH